VDYNNAKKMKINVRSKIERGLEEFNKGATQHTAEKRARIQ
jgi:hypothetical protein